VLPALSGAPIHVFMRPSLGPHLAAANIRQRFILLDRWLLTSHGEFERILVHELFHFVWVRLSNESRRDWQRLLEREFRRRVRGELGWSAEWRKLKLTARDVRQRTPAWRRYSCESFCDSAARVYSGLRRHEEFTLPSAEVRKRTAWMHQIFATNGARL
jgi:hypothetical protein